MPPNPTSSVANRFSGIVKKELSPAVRRAAAALWDAYEALDIELITNLRDAHHDLHTALPLIEHHEDEILELVSELAADLRRHFAIAADHPVRLRFAYRSEDDLIEQLLSSSAARVVVVPMEQDASLHTNVHAEIIGSK
jgi:hypothetical protein